jgi:hypothetical protein
MKKFSYFTIEINPEYLNRELESYGFAGWELTQILVIQRQIPMKINFAGQPGMQIEIKFNLIFKKEIIELKN